MSASQGPQITQGFENPKAISSSLQKTLHVAAWWVATKLTMSPELWAAQSCFFVCPNLPPIRCRT